MAKSKETIDEFLKEATGEIEKTEPVTETKKAEIEHERKYNKTEMKRKGLVNTYRAEALVPISIAPFYAPYLGKVVRQIVNGIVVDVPCNGETYQINETHASHIQTKIRRVNAMIARQNKAGDIKNNVEYSPGQLHI